MLFVATGILLNLTPGPDTFYILGRSVAQVRRAVMSRRLRENPSAGSKLTRASGVLFVGLGMKLAATK
ncbi:MAG TPA: hypothetical protein VFU28_02000 [Vicinamibacterales bacterium]|nr:hypothetical protein [Vicinamibacterales bacterium]